MLNDTLYLPVQTVVENQVYRAESIIYPNTVARLRTSNYVTLYQKRT